MVLRLFLHSKAQLAPKVPLTSLLIRVIQPLVFIKMWLPGGGGSGYRQKSDGRTPTEEVVDEQNALSIA